VVPSEHWPIRAFQRLLGLALPVHAKEGLVLFVPSTGSVGVGISLCTYAGQARLGVISDDAVVPADDPIGPHLGAALVEVSGGGAGVGGQGAEDLDDTVP